MPVAVFKCVTGITKPKHSAARIHAMMTETPTQLSRCPVCGGAIALWREKTTAHGTFPICRCKRCGLAFVNPRPTLEFLMRFYTAPGNASHPAANGTSLAEVSEEERKFPNSTLDAREMLGRVRALSREAGNGAKETLLDVGSGYGFFTRQAQELGYEVTAIELGPARSITQQMTGVIPLAIPFEEFDAGGERFSVIVMSQVLEHVLDVNLWAARAFDLLKPGGVLAIALPHFGSAVRRLMAQNDPFITPPEHLNFFTAGSLRTLLQRHGFELSATQHRSRIPARALERRLGSLGRPAVSAGTLAGKALCHVMDSLRMGIMIREYAIKPRHAAS
jgi:SAM-dependent methyltransferase